MNNENNNQETDAPASEWSDSVFPVGLGGLLY